MLNSPMLVNKTNCSCVYNYTRKKLPSGIRVVKHYPRADINPAAISIPGNFAIDYQEQN